LSAYDRELAADRAVLLRVFDGFDAELAAVETRVADRGSPSAAVARTRDAARIRDGWRAAPDPTDLNLDPSPVGWFTAQLAQARACLPGAPGEGFGPDASGRYTAPCLFDPHHEPANTGALWQPAPGLLPRPVLCCAEDAARLAAGRLPHTRMFATPKGPRPIWECDSDIHVWWLLGHFTLAGWDRLAATLAHTTPAMCLNRVMIHQGAGMK